MSGQQWQPARPCARGTGDPGLHLAPSRAHGLNSEWLPGATVLEPAREELESSHHSQDSRNGSHTWPSGTEA